MSQESTSPRSGSPIKAVLITLLLGALTSVGSYFYGLSQGNAKAAQAIASSKISIDEAEERAQKASERGAIFEAHSALLRSTVALDRRNFGIANTQIQNAASALDQAGSGSKIVQLRDQLRSLNINVATDLGTQRERVLGLASQIEPLLPSSTVDETSSAANPSAPEDTSSTP